MINRRIALLAIHFLGLVTLLLLGAASSAAAEDEFITEMSQRVRALTNKVAPAVVQIFTSSYGPIEGDTGRTGAMVFGTQMGTGSGVIVDPDGYIVTNSHVVKGARRIQVRLATATGEAPSESIIKRRGRLIGARLVGIDYETDLAVVKIAGQDLPYLELGNSDELFQGQMVLAVGSPLGLSNSVSMGIVSAVARQLQDEDPMIYVQHDAAVNPGNSGGPLVDSRARVVGINTLIYTQSGGYEGLSFAAPSNIVRAVYDELRLHGRVRRGMIGVNAQTIGPWLAEGLKLPRTWGVILSDVHPGGPADKAGLKIGDIVATLQGKVMENARQFDVNLYGAPVGKPVELEILRGGKQRKVRVEVLERVDPDTRFLTMVTPEKNMIRRIGILALDIDSNTTPFLPPMRKRDGVVVAALAVDALVFGEPFAPGDVIYELNGQPTPDLKTLRRLVRELTYGQVAIFQVQRGGQLRYLRMEAE